jgi:hypothetical protein
MRKTWLGAVALTLLLATPVAAQWVVFDPVNYASAIERLIQLQLQYTQLIETYQQIRAEYDHFVRMAQQLSAGTVARYRSAPPIWRTLFIGDRYGTLTDWARAVNTGDLVGAGYQRATQLLGDYGMGASRLPAAEWARIRTRYGTVELLDASTQQGLETIGQLRGRASAVTAATQALEDDSLSRADGDNTLIAVLNKINAAGVLSVRASHATNQLLLSLLESQLVDATRRREAEVGAINAHIAFEQEAWAFASRFSNGTTDAIVGFRLP